jgi:hypothetical protein
MLAMFEYRRVNQLGVIAPNCHREAREIVDTLPKATAEETQKAAQWQWMGGSIYRQQLLQL